MPAQSMRFTKTETLRQAQQLIAQGKVSAAISLYQKIVEADPSDLAAISVLGDLYVKGDRTSEAVEHLARIAENYLRSGSAITATHILNKVLKLDPTNARVLMNLGELSSREGKTDQAHNYFIEAGAAFWHKGNVTAAIKMNERALAAIPDSRQAKAALALLKQQLDQPKSAQEPKPITIQLPPILIDIPDASQKTSPAELPKTPLAESSHANEVKPEFLSDACDSLLNQEYTQRADEDAIVEQIARAELLVGSGQADQAIALLKEALHHAPSHIQIREKLKDIYLRSEMVDRASDECLNIAGIYAAQGKTSRAREYVRRARLLSQSVGPVTPLALGAANNGEDIQQQSLSGPLN